MTNEQAKKLEYPFTAGEIEWRVLRASRDKSKGQVAAFVDSRAIQKRLDAVLGRENWQNRFKTISGNANATTSHICEISIYYADRNEWITKSDGAGSTDIEPIKGGLSNAFKRAASMWGVGRYLYELTDVWVTLKDGKYIADSEKPKLESAYKKFVSQYLSKSQAKSAVQAQNNPKPQPTMSLPTGRFSSSVQQEKPESEICRVTDLQIMKGGRGPQTLLTLETSEGKALKGYVKGEVPFKKGQNLCDLKITTKKSPVVGNYNIIESYQIACLNLFTKATDAVIDVGGFELETKGLRKFMKSQLSKNIPAVSAISVAIVAVLCGVLICSINISLHSKFSFILSLLVGTGFVIAFILKALQQTNCNLLNKKQEEINSYQQIMAEQNTEIKSLKSKLSNQPVSVQPNSLEELTKKCEAIESFRNSFPYKIKDDYILFAILRTELSVSAFSRWQIVGEYNGQLWEYSLLRPDSQSYKEMLCLAASTNTPQELENFNQSNQLLWN